MIVLTSTWLLQAGCPPDLAQALAELPDKVRLSEPDTLTYRVHLQAPNCLGAGNLPLEPHPAPIPLDGQASITFFEVYASPEAFSAHVNGAVFQNFLSTYSHCFKQDPERPGWPITVNASLTPLAGFTRVPGD